MKGNKVDNPSLLITNFSLFCDKVLFEVNYARTNPKEYAKTLREMITEMPNTKTISINGYQMALSEGVSCIEEAIKFLMTQNPLKELDYNDNITQSAEELLNFLILHDGMNMNDLNNPNYDLEKRLSHYGEAFGELTELIDYGTFDPKYVVINFILSDGDNRRGERNTLFNPLITSVGVSAGLLPSERICTVLNFTQYFFGPGQIVPANFKNKILANKANQSTQGSIGIIRRHSSDLFKEKKKMYLNVNAKQGGGVIQLESTIKEEVHKEGEKIESDDDDEKGAVLPEGAKEIKTEETIKKDKDGKTYTVVKKTIIYEDGRSSTEIIKK